jgi:hypothetical protein
MAPGTSADGHAVNVATDTLPIAAGAQDRGSGRGRGTNPALPGSAVDRRHCLALLAAFAAPAWAVARAPAGAGAGGTVLAAAWDAGSAHRIGLLVPSAGRLNVAAATDVPTRAHGLCWERGGSVLAVARRPGDWLLRWHPQRESFQRVWNEPDRSFNGHVLMSPDGRTLYTTETDLETGAGLIGVRDADSLERRAEWPSHGLDPHELLFDSQGRLVIANGGIPTQAETGRAKRDLERMDSSLVRLDAANGRLLGQWRLDDPRLSLRHLARHGAHLAVALQAEHEDVQQRAAAPVLARFDGEALHLLEAARPLAGYGGSVAAWGGGFAVGCPRANGVAVWRPDGRWAGFTALPAGCAVAAAASKLWAGGEQEAVALQAEQPGRMLGLPAVRLDNHWVVAPAS